MVNCAGHWGSLDGGHLVEHDEGDQDRGDERAKRQEFRGCSHWVCNVYRADAWVEHLGGLVNMRGTGNDVCEECWLEAQSIANLKIYKIQQIASWKREFGTCQGNVR